MTSKGKRPLRHLTASDKIDAIQRIHDGESKASVARDIGVPESTLRGWCKNEDKLRFMSRQSAPDKLSEQLAEKMADGAAAAAAAVSMLTGPPEKRQKLDSSLPLNFSSKMKYDDLGYKRNPLNGLDFSTNKALSDLSFNGLGQDFSSFAKAEMSALNGACKAKGYGADMSKANDPSKSDLSMAAISPLTSLSHLSGMTGLAQSPLALSFNEIATNLNLIAQLNNPSLAAMTGLNGLNPNNGSIRNIKPKPSSHSPRNENDKPQGLSVKNWAKCQQKNSSDGFGMSLNDCKTKNKTSPLTAAQPLSRDAPVDDALWYWLKSQQTMLGLNNLYTALPSSTSPIRSSTPQQQHMAQHNHTTPTPPIGSTPQTPSSTPSGSSDDTKNSSWFWQWYKTFGASLMGDKQAQIPHSLLNNNNSITSNNNNNNHNNNNNIIDSIKSTQYDNILYSHLTKDSISNSDNLNNNEINNIGNKPEDLSAKRDESSNQSRQQQRLEKHSQAHQHHSQQHMNDNSVIKSEADTNCNAKNPIDMYTYKNGITLNNNNNPITNSSDNGCGDNVANNNNINNSNDENSSFNNISTTHMDEIGCNNNNSSINTNGNSDNNSSSSSNGGSPANNNNSTSNNNTSICSSNGSANSITNNNNNNHNNNNNNNCDDVKSDCGDGEDICSPIEALEHGEKFLKWLESYSDPRVTAMQVMQFRYLLSGIKSSAEQVSISDGERTRVRRRK